jgi:hypothetical protein
LFQRVHHFSESLEFAELPVFLGCRGLGLLCKKGLWRLLRRLRGAEEPQILDLTSNGRSWKPCRLCVEMKKELGLTLADACG